MIRKKSGTRWHAPEAGEGRGRGHLLVVLLVVLVAGCAEGAGPEGSEWVTSTDPELRALVVALLPGISERSGLAVQQPVRVERRSRSELEAYLNYRLDQDLPPEEAAAIVESYALLGMVPEALDLRGLLLSVYSEQVSGFYDPDSTALFVLDDQPAGTLEAVLVHELVHALQDQHVKLAALTAREVGNDRRTAAHAAIEGHATLVMLEYMTERLQGSPVDLSGIEDFSSAIRPSLAAMTDGYPVLRGAPAVIREGLLFPYVEGAGYVQALWRAGVDAGEGRPAPFGKNLPRSTRQVLEPASVFQEGPGDPVDVRITPPAGSRVRYETDLGWLETGILLEGHGGARDPAWGLRGDRLVLLDDEGGAPLLYWASVWDDDASRERFRSALTPALSRLPKQAVLENIEVDSGRGETLSGVLLRVGTAPEDAVTVRVIEARP